MVTRALQVLHPTIVAAAAVTVIIHPTSAQSHPRLEIAPALGGYIPAGAVEIAFECVTDPCVGPVLQQDRAVALGGRVTAWLGTRGGIEGAFWYSPSGVVDRAQYATIVPDGFGGNGTVILGSLRAVVSVTAPARTMSLLLMGGPALVHRAGQAWSYGSNNTSFAGTFGIGLNIHRGHGVSSRAAIEGYLYELRPLAPYWGRSTLHDDLVFSLSLAP